jgi:hypothetical protein
VSRGRACCSSASSSPGPTRQHVAATDRPHHRLLAHLQGRRRLPQPRHRHLQTIIGARPRWPPQRVDQHIARHRPIGVQHQQGKNLTCIGRPPNNGLPSTDASTGPNPKRAHRQTPETNDANNRTPAKQHPGDERNLRPAPTSSSQLARASGSTKLRQSPGAVMAKLDTSPFRTAWACDRPACARLLCVAGGTAERSNDADVERRQCARLDRGVTKS